MEENSLMAVAQNLAPKDFAKRYKKMLALKDELEKEEKAFKEKLITVFESIPELDTNSVTIDGLKFTYVKGSTRKSVDTKKLQEDCPEVYQKYLKESPVKPQIRTSVEY